MRHLAIIFGLLIGTTAGAQVVSPTNLASDMRSLVSVDTPRGPVPVRHCREAPLDPSTPVPVSVDRNHRATWWLRCNSRLQAFAVMFVASGKKHRVDPYLLAAMARVESGLNPFATGPIGEGGIAQLHPRGVGSRMRFVRDERYRNRCRRQVDACQRPIVDAQAEHIRAWLNRCDSVQAALGGYNRGRCGETAYGRNVMRQLERMRPETGSGA